MSESDPPSRNGRIAKVGRPKGARKWTQDYWYRRYAEAVRDLESPHSMRKLAARLGLTWITARSYYREWGPAPETSDAWQIRVGHDAVARSVTLYVLGPYTRYPIAQISMTYDQMRQVLIALTALNKDVI